MHGSMDLHHLTPGFDDPELVNQQTFRAIVKALDNPGYLVRIKS
jgi:alpha-D-ribose 1-methylphosphonate 5-triphosphate synthase subunit PhnH